MVKRYFIFSWLEVVVCTAFLFVSSDASALLCKSPSVEQAFNQAETVFIGNLQSIRAYTKTSPPRKLVATSSDGGVGQFKLPAQTEKFSELDFRIFKTWKGSISSKNKIVFLHLTTEQLLPLDKEKTYVIFLPPKDKNLKEIPENTKTLNACTPFQEIGSKEGYMITLLLDKKFKSQKTLPINQQDFQNIFVTHHY